MNWKIFVYFFGILFVFKHTEAIFGGGKGACAGHEVIPEYIRDCKGSKNPLGSVLNYSFVLNDDCDFFPNVCLRWKKVDADKCDYDVTVLDGKKEKFSKKGTASICDGFKRKDWKDAQETYPILRPYGCDLSKVKDKEGIKCITEGKTRLQVPSFVWGIAQGIVHGKVWPYDSKNPDVRSCYEFQMLVDYKRSG